MSDTDFIPNTYLNKSQIADKYSMSRVTVNKHLKKLETEGRLFPKTVQQGGRKLYWYDPNDLDVAFESIAKGGLSKRNVKHSVSGGFNVQNQLQIELLRKDIELEQKLRIKAEEEVADLKQQRSKQDQQIQFLQTQITDQRSVVLPEAPEPVTEEVVPPKTEPEEPKPATVAEIKEAVADADKSNVGPEEQSELSPETPVETKSNIDTEDEAEARRARIEEHLNRPEAEPKQYEKPKGFWSRTIWWLQGY